MRLRVSRLTTGEPRRARDTVGWLTPARNAMSKDVGLSGIDCDASCAAPSGKGAMMPGAACQKLLRELRAVSASQISRLRVEKRPHRDPGSAAGNYRRFLRGGRAR